MKDYSAMSDFEINAAVSICLGIEYAAPPEITGDGWKYSEGYFDPQNWDNPHRLQDYCNNPADAWPIIEENKISTMWMTSEKEWCAWGEGDLEEGEWHWENVPDYYFNCTSQLRAAMIVYLQMMEQKS